MLLYGVPITSLNTLLVNISTLNCRLVCLGWLLPISLSAFVITPGKQKNCLGLLLNFPITTLNLFQKTSR